MSLITLTDDIENTILVTWDPVIGEEYVFQIINDEMRSAAEAHAHHAFLIATVDDLYDMAEKTAVKFQEADFAGNQTDVAAYLDIYRQIGKFVKLPSIIDATK